MWYVSTVLSPMISDKLNQRLKKSPFHIVHGPVRNATRAETLGVIPCHGMIFQMEWEYKEWHEKLESFTENAADEMFKQITHTIYAEIADMRGETFLGDTNIYSFCAASRFCDDKALAFLNNKDWISLKRSVGEDYTTTSFPSFKRGYIVSFCGVDLCTSNRIKPGTAIGCRKGDVTVNIGEDTFVEMCNDPARPIVHIRALREYSVSIDRDARPFRIILSDSSERNRIEEECVANCVNCGAPLHGTVCEYCGTEYKARFTLC